MQYYRNRRESPSPQRIDRRQRSASASPPGSPSSFIYNRRYKPTIFHHRTLYPTPRSTPYVQDQCPFVHRDYCNNIAFDNVHYHTDACYAIYARVAPYHLAQYSVEGSTTRAHDGQVFVSAGNYNSISDDSHHYHTDACYDRVASYAHVRKQWTEPVPTPSSSSTTVPDVGITSDERIAVEALLALSSTQKTPRVEWNPFTPVEHHVRNQPTSTPAKPVVFTPKRQHRN